MENLEIKSLNNILELGKKYPNFVMNTKEQLELMRGNWGGGKKLLP